MSHRFATAALLAALFAAPIQAAPIQAAPIQVQAGDEGRSLMERGADLFLEGLTQEMAPALNDLRGLAEQWGPSMQGFLAEMGPAFAGIMDEVKDWSRYHPPEILSNGDIIMRRKADPKDEDGDEGSKQEPLPPSGPTDI